MPPGLRTRFAPAPTGYLHLGHVANALAVWGIARAAQGSVVLRIEDHDRQRCRPEYEAALLDDLQALGLEPHEPSVSSLRSGSSSPYRQSDNGPAYEEAFANLVRLDVVYACDCSRSTFGAWTRDHGSQWSGPGCPGACAERDVDGDAPGSSWRVAAGGGREPWTDLVLGEQSGEPAAHGDPPIRDRHGNWTYALCVVVDDLRHGIDLVIRGEDLLDATPAQVMLGRLLGRPEPPRFLHHPLIRRPDGRKLSKADGSTAVRERLMGGSTAEALKAEAGAAIGIPMWGDAMTDLDAPRLGSPAG
ncbi:MAG: glutamate--tRNA ligase family protein [Candidatus Limnocylindrales bacterium]